MPNQNSRFWTADKITRMRELWDKGLSNAEIAADFGKSLSAISKVLNANGMARFTQHRDPVDGFAELAPTMHLHELAKHFKANDKTILRWEKQLGVTIKRTGQKRNTVPPVRKASRPHGGAPWAGVVTQRATIDDSVFGEAQRTLQRWGPVYKVSTVHAKDETGDYIVWHKRMSAADMVALAASKGDRMAA